MALVDTGASLSLITKSLADVLNLPIQPAEGKLSLAIPGFEIPRIGHTNSVRIEYGNSTIYNAQFEIAPDLNGPPVFLGEDILSRVNLSCNGLPFRTNDAVPHSKDRIDPIFSAVEPAISSSRSDEPDSGLIQSAMGELQPELEANTAISPNDPCPLERAIVHLDTPEGRFTYRCQFPIAE